jgi:hypothetical protein
MFDPALAYPHYPSNYREHREQTNEYGPFMREQICEQARCPIVNNIVNAAFSRITHAV